MKRILALPFLAALLLPRNAPCEPVRLDLTLSDSQENALRHSPTLGAARLDRTSAEESASAQGASLLPQLGLDGSYKLIDKVPKITLIPGRPPVEFGDHKNWTAGVSASWTVWDWGALWDAWKSAKANAEGRAQSERMTRRQILLAVRAAYLQVRLSAEQTRLVSDSLNLSQSKLKDVEARVKAGTAGQLDLSSARQETLARRRDLREARAMLAGSLRDLFDLTGDPSPGDLSLPLDASTAAKMPSGIDPPSLVVSLEDEGRLRTSLAPPADAKSEDQPQARIWASAAEASRRQAAAAKAALLPRLQVSARSSYDYPNQMLLEQVQQNTAMVSANMPLFDWGRSLKQSAAARDAAKAAEARRDQAMLDWERDTAKARDQYAALKDEADLDREAAQEAVSFANLVGQSYRAGRSTYLEVESADLKALQAQVQSVRTSVQVYLQAAVLSSLMED